MDNLLQELIEKTGCSLNISYNDHKSVYQTTQYLVEALDITNESWREDIIGCTVQDMIDKDTVITLAIYPNTPVGCCIWYGVELNPLLQEASKWINS